MRRLCAARAAFRFSDRQGFTVTAAREVATLLGRSQCYPLRVVEEGIAATRDFPEVLGLEIMSSLRYALQSPAL
jgi:hypothetical protein